MNHANRIVALTVQSMSALTPTDFRTRLIQLLLGWATVAIAYFSVGYLNSPAITLPEQWIDKQLSFNPNAVWLYLSFFIYIPFAYFSVQQDRLKILRYATQICGVFAGVVFLLYPTQLVFPVPAGDSLSVKVLKILMQVDSTRNCLPSLHAALSAVCVLALWDSNRLFRSIASLFAGVAISISIVKLRRHLSIDLGAGLALGIGSYCLAAVLSRRNTRAT